MNLLQRVCNSVITGKFGSVTFCLPLPLIVIDVGPPVALWVLVTLPCIDLTIVVLIQDGKELPGAPRAIRNYLGWKCIRVCRRAFASPSIRLVFKDFKGSGGESGIRSS
jgi:hypothetical protein